MHILLLILKIIGILLLILLGLLLLFVLAVLFAPVRYLADGTLLEKKEVDISANWLLFVLRVACSIKNGEVTACVRLFGIPVFTYPKRKKQKEKKTDTKLPDETTETGFFIFLAAIIGVAVLGAVIAVIAAVSGASAAIADEEDSAEDV